MMNDFCIFILSHGRPENIITERLLKKLNYSGKYYIVIDDTDKKINEYKEVYGDKLLIFSKEEIAKTHDEGDNFNKRGSVFYARNATFKLSEKVGAKYFMQLDDDYNQIRARFNKNYEFGDFKILNFEKVLNALIKFYKKIPALTICFAQGGDFIGGGDGLFGKKIFLRRKAMNTFLCSTDRPFKFIGKINEDVNTYAVLGRQGHLFFTFNLIMINQLQTQSNSGGMTDMYLESGTYIKSFYSVMYAPSCVKVALMRTKNTRLHHKINWEHCSVKILSEKYKKYEIETY